MLYNVSYNDAYYIKTFIESFSRCISFRTFINTFKQMIQNISMDLIDYSNVYKRCDYLRDALQNRIILNTNVYSEDCISKSERILFTSRPPFTYYDYYAVDYDKTLSEIMRFIRNNYGYSKLTITSKTSNDRSLSINIKKASHNTIVSTRTDKKSSNYGIISTNSDIKRSAVFPECITQNPKKSSHFFTVMSNTPSE